MAIVETLRALVPSRSTSKTAQAWREDISALEQKQQAAQQRLANNSAERDGLALAAAQGDLDAASALDVASADQHGLVVALDNLDRALAQARRNLTEAAAREAREVVAGAYHRHVKAGRDRVEHGKDAEIAAQDLKRALDRVLEATARKRATFEAAKGRHSPLETRALDDRLDRNHVLDDFVTYLDSIGLAEMLGLPRRDLPRANAGFVDAIRAANAYHEIRPNGLVRMLSAPPPPEAA